MSNVTVTVASPTSAAGALTTYKVGFKTSGSGSLTSSSTITITLPAGTSLANLIGSPVMLGTTQVGFCTHPSNTSATCQLYSGQTIAASTTVAILLNGVTNPVTTSTTDTLQVKTTSDTIAVTSPTYAITAAHTLSGLTVTVASPTSAAGALTTYKLGFTTSVSGGMAGDTGSVMTITLPAGTSTANLIGSPVMLGTTQVGFCTHPSNTTATCQLYSGQTIAASTTVAILLNGVTNPATTSTTDTLQVKTTSDTTTVTSPTYAITAAHTLSGLTVTVASPTSAAGALTTYKLGFTTSVSGGMAGDTGSVMTITLPAGTSTANLIGSPVMLGTTQVGFCTHPSNTTATCQLYSGQPSQPARPSSSCSTA